MPNRLINESSPYLLQHAYNPVDWYAWGPEALERARAEDKPIILSVGYSACHWCHVMERESFEDDRIAEVMNQNFVCIKVDREERPDIDSIYMTAVQAMTGHGGWPMTVFLTPDAKPFYGGTYFPPEDRGGIPAFPKVVEAMARAYRDNGMDVASAAQHLTQRMRQVSAPLKSPDPLTLDLLCQAYRGIASQFDDRYGGIGIHPKFPQPMTYEFLLRHYLRTQDQGALDIVELTLDRMANGGIYDQIGGGFHRYSTDAFWLVPHFEKMLYDNALLVKLYLHAYQVTGKSLYRRIVEETLDYVRREMTDALGGFYSAQDADSDGVEGKFFVWRPEEIERVLGPNDADVVSRYYGVTLDGNFEGRSILNVGMDAASLARELGMSEEHLVAIVNRARPLLLEARRGRIRPECDDKVLTSWNALMLRAFAEAGAVLDRPDYTSISKRNANFLLENLRQGDRLLRTYRNGEAKLNGYLEDYSFLIDGLMVLHEATLEERWLEESVALGKEMVYLFWDEASGQFYDTGCDHEDLVVRPRDISDNATPAGSSMAAEALLRLAVVTGNADNERHALAALRSALPLMAQFPTGAGHWLCGLDFHLSVTKEIAVIGGPDEAATRALLYEVHRRFMPNHVLLGRAHGLSVAGEIPLPLLDGRGMIDGKPTAYVCRNFVCQLPVTDPGGLAKQLVDY